MMRYMKPLSLFQDLRMINALERGRFLGLDVGDKYVGLAVSGSHNKIAQPLSVLVRKRSNINLMAGDFQSLISEFSLVGVIVGIPFDRHQMSPDATPVKRFIDDLCSTGKLEGLRYTYWNECFTSKNVDLLLKPLKLHPVESKTILDKFAAVGILQGYLDYVNRSELNAACYEELTPVINRQSKWVPGLSELEWTQHGLQGTPVINRQSKYLLPLVEYYYYNYSSSDTEDSYGHLHTQAYCSSLVRMVSGQTLDHS